MWFQITHPLWASLIAQLIKKSACNAGDPSWFLGWEDPLEKGWATPVFLGFPCGSAGKESACNVGDLGLIPELGKSPGEGKGYPLQYSGLENSMWNSIPLYSPWGRKESDTTEWLSLSLPLSGTQHLGPRTLILQFALIIDQVLWVEYLVQCLAYCNHWANERFVVVMIINTNKERSPSQPQWALPDSPAMASSGDGSSFSSTKSSSDRLHKGWSMLWARNACSGLFQSTSLGTTSPLLHNPATWSMVLTSELSLGHLCQDRQGWLLKLTPHSSIVCFMEKSLTGAKEALASNTQQIPFTTKRDPC